MGTKHALCRLLGLAAVAAGYAGLVGASPAPVTLVATGSVWRYLDNGSNQGTAWRAPAFSDSVWASGPAQCGYGDGDEATVVSYGPNRNAKYVTTYFRQRFVATNASAFAAIEMRILRDDGIAVFLNGTRVVYNNLTGTSYTHTASSRVNPPAEAQFLTFSVPAAPLLSGTNTLAAEVHIARPNNDALDDDMSFDMSLVGHYAPVANLATSAVPNRLTEGETLQIPVRLDAAPVVTARVYYAVSSANATPGTDYSPASGVLVFPPSSTSQTLTVSIMADSETEPEEHFSVTLTNAASALLGSNLTFDCAIEANVAQAVTVTVVSARGHCTPLPGTNVVYVGTPMTFTATTPASDGTRTQYVCSGWAGTGSVPASGSGVSVSTTIRTNSTLTWLWHTNVWLTRAAGSGGVALGDQGWRSFGSTAQVHAATLEHYHFTHWAGDAPAASTNDKSLSLAMDRARDVTARFALNVSAEGTLERPLVSFAATNFLARFVVTDSDTSLDGAVQANISGCCPYPPTGELLVIANRGNLASDPPTIQVYDEDGVYRRRITMTGFDDTEGICLVDAASNLYAVVEEQLGNVCIVTIATNTTSLAKSNATVLATGMTFPSNNGLEGVTYDATNRCFYLVKEYSPMAVYRLTWDTNGVHFMQPFDAQTVLGSLVADISDLWYDATSGHLFILSDLGNRVMECTLAGQVIASLAVLGNQPEGLTFTDGGRRMFVVGEPNEYYRYDLQPAVTSGQEGAPATFPLVLSWAWTNALYVTCAVSSTNATSGTDFTPSTGIVSFAAGVTAQTVRIEIPVDTETEGRETLLCSLTNAVNCTVGVNSQRSHQIAANTSLVVRVASAHGGSVPAAGSNHFNRGTTLLCQVTNSPVFSGPASTQYVCVGWLGNGSTPASGSATSTPSFTLLSDSEITWLWRTNHHLSVTVEGSGSVDVASGWYPALTALTARAQAAAYHHFRLWRGDIDGSDTNDSEVTVTMDRPRAVSAVFDENLATNGTPEWWLALNCGATNDFDAAAMSDADADGLAAWKEYRAGTHPSNASSVLRISGVSRHAGLSTVKWLSVSNRLYAVERAARIDAGWDAVPGGTNLPGDSSGTSIWTDAETPATGALYRIHVLFP